MTVTKYTIEYILRETLDEDNKEIAVDHFIQDLEAEYFKMVEARKSNIIPDNIMLHERG